MIDEGLPDFPMKVLNSDSPYRQRSDWFDRREYPFQSRWLRRGNARMHYVDQGQGRPILMLHGTPTWSFMYRNAIQALSRNARCIAPDYPGFGLSEHPRGYGYTPQEHAEWIGTLIAELKLDDFVLVLHDWGGSIGLAAVLKRADSVAGLVLSNTWCWPLRWEARLFSHVVGGSIGKLLILRANVFARVIMERGIARPGGLNARTRRAYVEAFPTPRSRIGTWVFPRSVREAASWQESIESQIFQLGEIPVRMVWGMQDPAFARDWIIRRWLTHFPAATVEFVRSAGHYLPEERPDRLIAAIEAVLAECS
jgi:haloalkane dehalogenase